jgi:hypothetical protein
VSARKAVTTIQRASDAALNRVELFPARCVHQIFSATRNFALRDRGLRRCSFSLGLDRLRRDQTQREL